MFAGKRGKTEPSLAVLFSLFVKNAEGSASIIGPASVSSTNWDSESGEGDKARGGILLLVRRRVTPDSQPA